MSQPSFWSELKAMGRQGATDLHNAVVPAFPDSQKGVDVQGTPMHPTNYEVTKERQGYTPSSTISRGDESPEMDMEIE
jgi:hypothetical protein